MIDVQPLEQEDSKYEEVRKAVETTILGYVGDHFSQGVASVFESELEGEKTYLIICVNATIAKPKSMWYDIVNSYTLIYITLLLFLLL